MSPSLDDFTKAEYKAGFVTDIEQDTFPPGLDESVVPEAVLDRLAARVARSGTAVEVNEKWRCPSPRTVAAMLRAGVPVVAGSDSHHCRDVGVYRSVLATAGQLAAGTGGASR